MSVQFNDFSIQVKDAMQGAMVAYLYEAAGEVEARTKRNSRVDTGQTKNAWQYMVDEDKLEATIGNPLENAIWEEFGTGEYALKGNGRKGGWFYVDRKGKGHFTHGKKPTQNFKNSFDTLKPKLIKRAGQVLKGLNK